MLGSVGGPPDVAVDVFGSLGANMEDDSIKLGSAEGG